MNVKTNERKMNGPNRGYSPDLALEHSQPEKEVGTMSHYGQYRDSARKIKTAHTLNLGAAP